MEWLEKVCIEYKPQFLVIDTFFKLLDISDLNDYVKTNKAIEPIFKLSKKYNVHIQVFLIPPQTNAISVRAVNGNKKYSQQREVRAKD